LLIYFGGVTLKNSNVGLQVMLPNPPKEQLYDDPEVHERNIMKVYVNKDNEIMVAAGKDEPITLTVDELGTLRELAKVFITANTPDGIKNDNYPELQSKKDTIIHLNEHGVECYYPAPYSNAVWNNKHVITLQTDRSTSYEVYFKVQEALYGAYNDLRNDFAKEVYGVANPENQLSPDELELCRRRYVNMISEAQPIEIGKRQR
jgi:biopolymer transport protein ExbD